MALASMVAPPTAEAAIQNYCEPLLAGASARQLEGKLLGEWFNREQLAGQQVLRRGELILALSDAPKVCFVQAPRAMSKAEGFALADRWAARFPGAVRSAATTGPDGAPVRGWSAPARKMALIASHQTTASGQPVMAFILMPLPQGARR